MSESPTPDWVLLLLAERMRNAGRYTMADLLTFRLSERPAHTAAYARTPR